MSKHYSLSQLAKQFNLEYQGKADYAISGVGSLDVADHSQIAFFNNPKLKSQLQTTKAGIVILPKQAATLCPTNCLLSDNPYLSYAKIAALFAMPYPSDAGVIHQSVVVDADSQIDASVSIGANCVIAKGVKLGANVRLGPGCVLEAGVSIGENTELKANVVLCKNVSLGRDCLIHSGAVIGCDGFGNAKEGEQWVKVPQLGSVQVGDRVEIGANTTIDCGAIQDTIISDGARLDNLIQIAHNVEIGENTAIAAGTGIAGSTKIGKNCMIAGKVGINGHIEIVDNVIITAMTMVTKSLLEPGVYSSGIPVASNREWRKNAVRFAQLDELTKRVKQLESNCKE